MFGVIFGFFSGLRFSFNQRKLICGLGFVIGGVFITSAQPYGLNSRPNVAPFLNNNLPQAGPPVSTNWVAVPAFPNLYFTNILGFVPLPGTNRLCAWEREGRIWTFANDTNTTTRKLVLDISNQCQGWDDCGLLAIAFHPGFATNHYLFVYYTWVTPGSVTGDASTRPTAYISGHYHDRVSRFTLDANGVTSTNSELVLVDQAGNSAWHNGSQMFFHPTNGFLYWTDGDDIDGDNTQTITRSLFSGVFRIDVDMRGGSISHAPPRLPYNAITQNYYIPNNNPFVGQANALEEFFCLGLRSPYRMTIDPPSGRIFIGEVGQDSREEIDIIEPNESGLNFQWNVIEGLQGDLTQPYIGVNKRPILDYTHASGDGYAVIGGHIYRGSEFASELGGRYIFGDNVTRTVWVMDMSTNPATKTALCTLPAGSGPNSGANYTGLSSFALNQSNELFMCQMSSVGGRIFKLAHASSTSQPLPQLLSQTGAFTNLTSLAPSSALIPYTVNSPLWSDGAIKSRWMVLATNTFINFATNGEWTFPNGTVFVKHFELSVNDTNPTIRQRLETRLLIRDTNGTVFGGTYKWRPDNSDADLVSIATNQDILITTATGTRTQQWFFPGPVDCLRCHTTTAGGVLGVKTRQLNGNFTYPTTSVTDNQLRTWNHIGLFSSSINENSISNFTKLVSVTNTSATLELRARSYLDANCSQCHRPGGTPALFDARFDTTLTNQAIINGLVGDTLGISGAKVIVPGDTNKSILYLRDNSLGSIKMPPLAKNVVDSNAVAVIAAWINSLPSTPTPVLPPWHDTDIGSVGYVGNATYLGGEFDVSGAGLDIWNNADAFNFVYRPLSGNGQIIARVTSVQATDPWAKVGVMFRESLDPGSKHSLMAITSANGAAFQRRTVTDGGSSHTGILGITAPYWVRLTRGNNTFTGYISPDGTNWTQVDNVSISMTNQIYVGLAVCADNNSVVNTSAFDKVSVTFSNSVPPKWVSSVTGLTNHAFHLRLSGSDEIAYVIEATTNLTAWTPIFTNPPSGGFLDFTEPNTFNYPRRFYRAHEQ